MGSSLVQFDIFCQKKKDPLLASYTFKTVPVYVEVYYFDTFNLLSSLWVQLTAFQVLPSRAREGHKRELYIRKVITWSIFYLLPPPLLEAIFMYLLSSFQLALCFLC